MSRYNLILATLLVAVVVLARLLPHAPNIAPVAAVAIFAGLYLPKKWGGLVLLAAMLLSDAVLGFYDWRIMASVYGSFLITWLVVAVVIRREKNIATVAVATLGGSLLFFLTTNAAVWAFGTMYPHTLSGLDLSYTMALPFFRNTLIGDVLYTTVLVGGFEAVSQFFIRRPIARASHH